MRILVAGDGHSELHELPLMQAFRSLGHQAEGFLWHSFFEPAETTAKAVTGRLLRAQDKFVRGPAVARLNRALVEQAAGTKPDMLFVYRGTHVEADSLRRIRAAVPGMVIVGYNNDDPFGPGQPGYRWRHFLSCLPEYDLTLAYRQHNMDEFRRHGARRVYLLRSWFIPERNHPVALSPEDRNRFDADVVFAGHYEDDGRLEQLEAIVAKGHRLRLFGPGNYWNPVLVRSQTLRHLAPVRQLWGEDYNKALCGARIALCFFSRLNRDTYTRRCFEIPATGTLLLSEYSDDLANLFKEGLEADYFRSREEMLEKINFYLVNNRQRSLVASAGLKRVHQDGHDIRSRLATLMTWMRQQGLFNGVANA